MQPPLATGAKRWEPRFVVAGLLTPLAVLLSVWLLFIGAFGLDLEKHVDIFVWCVLGLLWLAVFTFPWGLGAKK